MEEEKVQKFIGYAVLAIIVNHILNQIMPLLVVGVVGLVLMRVYQAVEKHRK